MSQKVYGPYLRKDGRKHVIIVYGDGHKRTVSYGRLVQLGRIDRLPTQPSAKSRYYKLDKPE